MKNISVHIMACHSRGNILRVPPDLKPVFVVIVVVVVVVVLFLLVVCF